MDPEILIIDEVLAVGDAEFQKKCLGKMEDVSKSGRTILFVSHNLAAIENLCSKGILLDQGKLKCIDPIEKVIDAYQSLFGGSQSNQWENTGNTEFPLVILKAGLNVKGAQPQHMLSLQLDLKSGAAHKDAFLAIDISNSAGITIGQAIPILDPFIKDTPSTKTVEVEVDLPPLIPDLYKVSIWLGSHNTETFCWEKEILGFEIVDSPTAGRNFPHTHNHGFVVPNSRVQIN